MSGQTDGAAADAEPLATAFEALTTAMSSQAHDWADDEDEGLPPADIYAGILPEEVVDELDAKVGELPEDAPLEVSIKNCPPFLNQGHVHHLFEGLQISDVRMVRHSGESGKGKGKQVFVAFASRHSLAAALHRTGECIGYKEIEVVLAAEDPDYVPPAPVAEPPAGGEPPPPPYGGEGPAGHGPPPGGRRPDHGPPGAYGGPPLPRGGGGPGYYDDRRGPPPGPSGPPRGPGGPRPPFDMPHGGGGGGPPRGYGGPPPYGAGPPGGFRDGPPGPRRMSNEYGQPGGPPRHFDDRHGPGPGGFGGRPGPGGFQEHRGPPGGYHAGPPPPHMPRNSPPMGAGHLSGPPPSERPRLKLAPRSKPLDAESGPAPSAHSSGKPNPFGSAKPVDTAAKLAELDKKEHAREGEKPPHAHSKLVDGGQLGEVHSALVDPPSARADQ